MSKFTVLLVDIGLSGFVGGTVAWVARRNLPQSSLLRASSLWALILYEVFVAVPVAVLLAYRFPMWRVANLFEAQPRTAMMLVTVGPLAAFAAYLSSRKALLTGKPKALFGVLLGSAALLAISTAIFMLVAQSGPVARESGRSLGHLAIGGLAVCIAGFVMMAWRIHLLASSERPAASVTQLPAQVRDGRTKPIEVRKSSGKR